ncbi:MAG: glycosyl hydrolase, partial [Victivallaceae bacterium]|nr:glycosyl hydrolase [Victivallaceae bacterium]
PEQMKWITDFQYVRGINITTMSCYQFSTRAHFMGWGGIKGPADPLWKHMDLYHRYTARTSYLLSRGKPEVETAVYYPVRDLWAGGPELKSIAHGYDALAGALLENQCDFDLIDDDLLERQSTRATGGRLQAGKMTYHTVCVPKTRWMTAAAKAKLEEFARNGGTLLWFGNAGSGPLKSIAAELRQLKLLVKPLFRAEPAQKALRGCKRRLGNGRLYFITNEDIRKGLKCTVTFNETLPPFRLDPETGSCFPVTGAVQSGTSCSIPLTLDFAGSCVIQFLKIT